MGNSDRKLIADGKYLIQCVQNGGYLSGDSNLSHIRPVCHGIDNLAAITWHVNKVSDENNDDTMDENDNDDAVKTHQYYPYLEQAGQLARRQLKSASSNFNSSTTTNANDGEEEEEDKASTWSSSLSSMSSTSLKSPSITNIII